MTGLEPFDVGALIVASNEVLRDASLDAELWLRDQIVRTLAAALDAAFIDPANTGTGGIKPASVTSGTGTAGDSPSESFLDWGDPFTGDPLNAWIILNPYTAARLSGAAPAITCSSSFGTCLTIPMSLEETICSSNSKGSPSSGYTPRAVPSLNPIRK